MESHFWSCFTCSFWRPDVPEVSSYPGLEATFYSLMDRLNADPIRVDIGDDGVTLGGVQFAALLRQALYFSEALPYFPRLIYSTASGNLGPLADMIQSLPSYNGSEGMLLSVHCAEETLFVTETEVENVLEALHPSLRDYASAEIDNMAELCKLWKVPRAPAFTKEPVTSNVPVLLLAGQYDPVTRLL